jgi:hypothetical protein
VAYSAERAVGLNSSLVPDHIVEAYTVVAVAVGDDIDSGRNHHIDIEVDILVLVLALAIDFDPADDEQLAKAMNLVERAIPLLQGEHGMAVWKMCLWLVEPS